MLISAFRIALFSQNLVVNPGFESWEKITKPSGWVHAENCLKDSSEVISGLYSCRHTGGATTTSDLGQTIPISSGSEYSLSFFYKTDITSTGNGVRIWCYWKNADGSSITDPVTDAVLRPSKYLKSSTWEQFSLNIVAPSEAVAFYLEVRTYPNCAAYWDDFVFAETITTGVTERTDLLPVIYPNPAISILSITNTQAMHHIDIMSISGINIWSADLNGENTYTVPVDRLPVGIYIIRIQTSSKTITRTFIKKEY